MGLGDGMSHVAILIPSFNNLELLAQTLTSLRMTIAKDLAKIYIVNNGHPDLRKQVPTRLYDGLFQMEENLGWEGALKYGVEKTTEPFVLFLNDDVFFPYSNGSWLQQMMTLFDDPLVGVVGPSSNIVLGQQNIFYGNWHCQYKTTAYIIGLCFLTTRKIIEEAGGIEDQCPGGDDFDLSIRIRNTGRSCVVTRDVYVHHHAFQTGARVHGAYWNSTLMMDRTNAWLIKKHGMKKFHECMSMPWAPYFTPQSGITGDTLWNSEGAQCVPYVQKRPVLEIGCGSQKTVPDAMGVDLIPKGETIAQLGEDDHSVADLVGDVTGPLPVEDASQGTIIARHILEHCVDTLQTLMHWWRALQPGGRLIVAVPDHQKKNTIVLNPEHCHGFTPESLSRLAGSVGFIHLATHDPHNGISFVSVFERPLAPSLSHTGTNGSPPVELSWTS